MPGLNNISPALAGLVPVLVAIVSGALIPFQAGANATLGRSLGHPLWATRTGTRPASAGEMLLRPGT